MVDGFDHLDRDDGVVLPSLVSEVEQLEGGPVGEPGVGHPLLCVLELLLGDREPGHRGTDSGGILGEPSPSAADLEHVGPGRHSGEFGDPRILGLLGGCEIVGVCEEAR